MGITATLAKLSAIYQTLSKVDNKTYGFKNGEFFEVVGGGGGGTDDGVTLANICDLAMDGNSIISSLAPVYFKPGIGGARAMGFGGPSLINLTTGGDVVLGGGDSSTTVAGTGASVGQGSNSIVAFSGTTATGAAKATRAHGPLVIAGYASEIYQNSWDMTRVGVRIAARLKAYVAALSDATDTYTARWTLLGAGPASASAPAADNIGITFSYKHDVNAGNLVMTYRNSAGALVTVNTPVPMGTFASPVILIAKAVRSAAGVATVVVNVGASTYTLTDTSFNNSASFLAPSIAVSIAKTVGTTSRHAAVRDAAVAFNFA